MQDFGSLEILKKSLSDVFGSQHIFGSIEKDIVSSFSMLSPLCILRATSGFKKKSVPDALASSLFFSRTEDDKVSITSYSLHRFIIILIILITLITLITLTLLHFIIAS